MIGTLLLFTLSLASWGQPLPAISVCQNDRDLHCPGPRGQHDVVMCLKRYGNLLTPACFKFVSDELATYRRQAAPPAPAPIPAPPPSSSRSSSPSYPPPDTGLIRREADRALYQRCMDEYDKLPRGYFVLEKSDICGEYAKVHPEDMDMPCIQGTLGAKPKSKDYFWNYSSVAQFCQSNRSFSTDSSWQNCVQSKIGKGKGGEAVRAYHTCNKRVTGCIQDMEKITASAGRKEVVDLYYAYCASDPEHDIPEMRACVAREIKPHPDWATKFETLNGYCHPRTRPCVLELIKEFEAPGKKLKSEDHVMIAELCRYREIEALDAGWPTCVFQSVHLDGFSKPDAQSFCSLPAEGPGRICIHRMMKRGLLFGDAKWTCRYQTASTRDCLAKFFLKSAPFDVAPMSEIGQKDVETYCALESDEERTCFTKEWVSGGKSPKVVGPSASKCREGSQEYKDCMDDFTHYFKRAGGIYGSQEDGQKICMLTGPEMRSCMFSALIRQEYIKKPNMWNKYGDYTFPFEEYQQKCLNEYLGYLLAEMKSGKEWDCRNAEFENLTIYQKSTMCQMRRDDACRRFHRSLSRLTDDELRADCGKYNLYSIKLKDDPAFERDVLLRECTKRGLIPGMKTQQ